MFEIEFGSAIISSFLLFFLCVCVSVKAVINNKNMQMALYYFDIQRKRKKMTFSIPYCHLII